MRNLLLVVAVATALTFLAIPHHATPAPSVEPKVATNAEANELIRRQPGFFVPNQGQWKHPAKFVHRSGPMTLFLEDRGWVIDLVERPTKHKTNPHEAGLSAMHPAMPGEGEVDQKIRGVALRMTFEGDAHVPEMVGEGKLPGYHNYFLGNDESRWRTGVPLYGSVRYCGLYPGIDVRVRLREGHPEYDLLCDASADLSAVSVAVEGAAGLTIGKDGSLVIETALGPITQPKPSTWERLAGGGRRTIDCEYVLLGRDRFGFIVADWSGARPLVIDPGLLWSTLLGETGNQSVRAVSVDGGGLVTVAGATNSLKFPTTPGAYGTTYNGGGRWEGDAFVSRLDPSKRGAAQLVHSTYLGGSRDDSADAVSVDAGGVVTIGGRTTSPNYPTTVGAYDRTHNGSGDAFVTRLIPTRTALMFSTYLGGNSDEYITGVAADVRGVVTVAGGTSSVNFPVTTGAFDMSHNGASDGFVARLDTLKTGGAQFVYSTFVGGRSTEFVSGLSADARDIVTIVGSTNSGDYPTTSTAYGRFFGFGFSDAFVSRLDLRKSGASQLVYSTYLGHSDYDMAWAVHVDAGGVVTVAGQTNSKGFPTTLGAFDRSYKGGLLDAFVSRLDPQKIGSSQLVYSTLLGGIHSDSAMAIAVDTHGVVTVAGGTASKDFPTTSGALDTTHNQGMDAFVSRLDPRETGNAQLVYSTFLGGISNDLTGALAIDASGVVTVAGYTISRDFPTTIGAYDTIHRGGQDAFLSRLEMGVAMYGDAHEISITAGGTQVLTVNAGKPHANRLYWIFGSITGTKPGVNLLGVHIPLNPDLYTDVAMANVNTTVFTKFKGTLDANGLATASFNVPANLPVASGFTFHHAYVVYDASGKVYMPSNAVPLTLR